MCKLLIKWGADPRHRDSSAFKDAFEMGFTKICRVLLDGGCAHGGSRWGCQGVVGLVLGHRTCNSATLVHGLTVGISQVCRVPLDGGCAVVWCALALQMGWREGCRQARDTAGKGHLGPFNLLAVNLWPHLRLPSMCRPLPRWCGPRCPVAGAGALRAEPAHREP